MKDRLLRKEQNAPLTGYICVVKAELQWILLL